MTETELQQLVEEISLRFFQRPFEHQAIFYSRLRSTGGRYHLTDHHLDFNPKVLEEHGLEHFIGVIKHELCHYHLHLCGKGYRHADTDFKELLAKTGGSRYTLPLKSSQTGKFHQYRCRKCEKIIERKRKIDTIRYGCKCGGRLDWIQTIEK